MTELIALAIVTATFIVALERSHRRHSDPWSRPTASQPGNDRDWARTKLDLLAAGAAAEPYSHKPLDAGEHSQTRARRAQRRGRTGRFDPRAA